jgi:hypothetical protein
VQGDRSKLPTRRQVLNFFRKVVEQLVPVLFSAAAVVQRVIQQVAPYPRTLAHAFSL